MGCEQACKLASGQAGSGGPFTGVALQLRLLATHQWPLIVGVVLALAVPLAMAAWLRARSRRRRIERLAAGGTWFRLIPPAEASPGGGQAFWEALHSLRGLRSRHGPWVVWHLAAVAGSVGIWLWVPDVIPEDTVMRTVQGAWRGARTEPGGPPAVEAPALPSARQMWAERAAWREARQAGEDPPEPQTPSTRLVGAEFGLHAASPHALDADAGDAHVALLLAQFEDLHPGEAVVVQVLARPAHRRVYRRVLQEAHRLEENVQQLRAVRAPGATREAGRVRAVEPKLTGSLWSSRLRVAVLANHPGRATARIDGVCSSFGVLRGPLQRLVRRPSDFAPFDLRHHHGAGSVLSVEEMAALASLPPASVLEPSRARVVTPTKEIATKGLVIGHSVGRPVAIKYPDVLHHVHIVGPTGSGKTTWLTDSALQLSADGWSVVAVDISVKGDIPPWILERLPEDLDDRRVCVIDPTADMVPAVNVLASANPMLASEQLLTVFSRLYSGAWGPKIESILRPTFLTLALAGGTLVEVDPLLTDGRFRERVLNRVLSGCHPASSPLILDQVRGFWSAFESKSDAAQVRDLESVLYKLAGFMPPSIAAIIGQVNPKGDPLDLIDRGGLVLVRAPQGEVGEGPAALLGSLVAVRMWQRVQARSKLSEAARQRLHRIAFLADEAQSMFGGSSPKSKSASEMLEQGRGLRLGFLLGHQQFTQLNADLQEALATNGRTKVFWELSETDAKKAAASVAPEFRVADLMALAPHQCICRPCVDGGQAAPFTFRTEPLGPGSEERKQRALAVSAQEWARPRQEVEQEMVDRQRGHLQVVR